MSKKVSEKQSFRFAKKWIQEILLRLDDIERRLTALEKYINGGKDDE